MKISKIINNNIVSSLDDKKREIIVMGKGLGFGKKPDMDIDEQKIEKIFRMDTPSEMKQFTHLLRDVPLEIVQVVTQIINKAKEHIPDKLQESIYLTLIDHINFIREKQRQNIQFHNPLLYDIKRLYKVEYKIGEEAVKYINTVLGVDFPKEEAASIALHFINARLGMELPESISVAKIIQNTLKIVQYSFNITIDHDSMEAEYFTSYLKFFAQRVINNTMLKTADEMIDDMVMARYHKSYSCVIRIANYIKKEYEIQLSQGEMIDLTVQIERITNK